MASVNLSLLSTLPVQYKTALERGGIHTAAKLLFTSPQEAARKCHLSPIEIATIIDITCRECNQLSLRFLEDISEDGDEFFSTGDAVIDSALGGGIRTGMIWEVVGESAAGKTQFALQLSLSVQTGPELGGLGGSCCYLTTSSKLPTERLLQISENHKMLSSTNCSLSHVHTITVPSIPVILHVLSRTLLDFMQQQTRTPGRKPVKLIVIDALAELFHEAERTTTATLVERSRNISEIGSALHTIAAEHHIAIVVLNEVVDAFERGPCDSEGNTELAYSNMSRWFARGHSLPGEDRKEASLGLVWANQVNARILLSRTGRRRHLAEPETTPAKARKIMPIGEQASGVSISDAPQENDQLLLLRRFNVIFSTVSPPVSLDYIITESGISALPDSIVYPSPNVEDTVLARAVDRQQGSTFAERDVAPLDVGTIEDAKSGPALATPDQETPLKPEDEWEKFWDNDEIPAEVYYSFPADN